MDRREFLWTTTAAAACGVVAAGFGRAAGRQSNPDTGKLYDNAIVVDALSIETWDEAGFAAWKKSGYTAIQTSLSDQNFQIAAKELAEWHDRFAKHPDKLIHCTKAAHIEQAKKEGKLAVILGFQNGTVIEDRVTNLDRLYQAGARCIQLTYNARNLLGDGCTERTNAGLSDFGIECVEKMNELGIIVDLSHCGEQTSADGIAFSKQPPAFTHTVCKALYFHPRAKPDELLRAISNRGGMTGIAALGYFVSPRPDATVEDYLNHIDHAVKVCGIDHVGLATDFQIRGIETSSTRENWYLPRLKIFKPSYNVRWPPWIPELDKPERFRTVAQALSRRGYRSGDIEKILGRNWFNYFRAVLSG
jgi:membrane dipeptidase